MSLNFNPSRNDEKWETVLKYILDKQTHTAEFQELFASILADPKHSHYTDAKRLKMLYDFTPLRRAEPPSSPEEPS